MKFETNKKNIINDAITKEIIEKLSSLKYGNIQITVHNSKVVQIDKIEKTRFDDVWAIETRSLEKGGEIKKY